MEAGSGALPEPAMNERVDAVEALLVEAEAAHGAYEATELNGVYDEDWPSWYARYAVDHGIGTLLGRPASAAELERFLATCWTAFRAADPPPAEPWARYTARRLGSELSGA